MPNVTTDDIAFTSEILDQLESQYCIDTNRIYATGKSQGGGFVGVLACDAQMSRRIAAFAPVSGAFYQTNFGTTCNPNTVPIAPCSPGRRDIPILNFHGLVDNTIAYYGGLRRRACLPAIPYWCQTWAENDGLALVNTSSGVPGALDGSTAVKYEWGDGLRQGLVTHIMDGVVSAVLLSSTVVRLAYEQEHLATALEISHSGISYGTKNADQNTRLGHWARLALYTTEQRQFDARSAPSDL